jgi:hypothetical protein
MTTAYCLTGCVPVIAHAIQTYKVCISEAIHVESLKKVQPELPGWLSILSSLSPLCRDADDRGDLRDFLLSPRPLMLHAVPIDSVAVCLCFMIDPCFDSTEPSHAATVVFRPVP